MEGMDNLDDYTRPDIQNAGAKTLHWLMTLFFLFVLPSLSTVMAFAERSRAAMMLQCAIVAYAIIEAIFLRFADNDGVENRTSRGTAWCILLVSIVALASGLLKKRTIVLHKALSFLLVIVGWVKVCLAPIALFGFCRELHTGQCIAHGIMGSAFVLYGFVYVLVLMNPFNTTKYSQDFYDCLVISVWGCINTFTEHRWGREGWNHGDYQHTAMGIVWWCGGLLGLYLAKNGGRSFVPGLIIMVTGWAMSEHAQHLIISTKVHGFFGQVLLVGGALRIVEICFLLRDKEPQPGKIWTFQYLPPFALVCAGIMFMGANEEQLVLVLRLAADHSSYIMILVSSAFMVYLWFIVNIDLYLKLNTNSKNLDAALEMQELEFDTMEM